MTAAVPRARGVAFFGRPPAVLAICGVSVGGIFAGAEFADGDGAVVELEHEWALGGFGAGPVEACGGFDHLVLVDDLPAEPWGRFRAGSPAIVLVPDLPRWSGTSPGARMSASEVSGIFWSRCSVFCWHWARSRTRSRSFPRRWPFPTRRRCVGRR